MTAVSDELKEMLKEEMRVMFQCGVERLIEGEDVEDEDEKKKVEEKDEEKKKVEEYDVEDLDEKKKAVKEQKDEEDDEDEDSPKKESAIKRSVREAKSKMKEQEEEEEDKDDENKTVKENLDVEATAGGKKEKLKVKDFRELTRLAKTGKYDSFVLNKDDGSKDQYSVNNGKLVSK